jgi:hypothetical protein
MGRSRAELTLVALAGIAAPAGAGDIAEQIKRLGIMNPAVSEKTDSIPQACSDECTKYFWRVLEGIRAESAHGQKLRGEASLGLETDESRDYAGPAGSPESAAEVDPNLYKLDAALRLRRGTYPGEFKFDAAVEVQLKDDKFQQNMRDLFIAYDHWVRRWAEGFVFASQFSDGFMAIDQRYEVGVGMFFGKYFGQTANPRDPLPLLKTDPRELDGWIEDLKRAQPSTRGMTKTDSASNPSWLQCYTKFYHDPMSLTKLKEVLEEIDDRDQWQDAVDAQVQRSAQLRLGVAVSVFGEAEHPALKPAGAGAEDSPLTLPTTWRYRLAVRPTFEWKPNRRWDLKADWYFKLPMPLSDLRRASIPGEDETRFDYRYDLDLSAAFSVTQKDLGEPGDVSVDLRYRRIFDNVPPFYAPTEGANAAPFTIAPDTHTKVTVNLAVKW